MMRKHRMPSALPLRRCERCRGQGQGQGHGRGQAMVEFLISLVALIPLFFLIAMLGKYLDLKATIVQGARYAAWERTVWNGDSNGNRTNNKSAQALQNEMRERLFSDSATIVRNDDGGNRNAPRANPNRVWNDYANNAILLPVYSGTTGATVNAGDPGALGKGTAALMVILGSAGKFGSFGSSSFSPNTNGLYSAQLQVKINTPPPVIRGLGSLSGSEAWDAGAGKNPAVVFGAGSGPNYASNVLMADAWSASGPTTGNNSASVKDQVSGLVPTSWLAGKAIITAAALKPALDGIEAPTSLPDAGKIEPDLIPADRRK